ncbi:hypothetical protein PMAYCL1PPCAC_08001, partial [Pristionchus mayeri]
ISREAEGGIGGGISGTIKWANGYGRSSNPGFPHQVREVIAALDGAIHRTTTELERSVGGAEASEKSLLHESFPLQTEECAREGDETQQQESESPSEE